jgi:hypothetical protein
VKRAVAVALSEIDQVQRLAEEAVAEQMRAACIAAVEALRGLTDDELLAPRALPETNEEWVARARILAVLREVQT